MKSEVVSTILMVLVSLSIANDCLSQELSNDARGRINEFLRIAQAETATKENTQAEPEFVYEVSLDEVVRGIPLVKLKTARWHATVNGNSGDIYSYGIYQMFDDEKEIALTRGLKEAVSKELVSDTYSKLAALYGVDVVRANLRVRLVDPQEFSEPATSKAERNLYGCHWDLRNELTYKGYPCRGRYLNVAISPVSGRIGLVGYRPVLIPGPEEWKIAASEALNAVQTWLDGKPYFSEKKRSARLREPLSSALEKVIACPRQYPEEQLPSRGASLVGQDAYYCWEVPFEYQESGHWFSAVAWVRASVPDVIGWNDDRKQGQPL